MKREVETQAYTAAEVGVMMGLHRTTATRLFENEPGVILITRPETNSKRRYRTLRIPHHVYERVIRRLSVR